MRTVGIIGGLGPETTAKFYLEIVNSCAKLHKSSRPPILIWNVPIPFKTEEDLILKGEGQEKYLPFLFDAAKRLERGGADFLVMPCNSMHVFIEEIRNVVSIPVISIVEETVEEIKNLGIKKVGILATGITLKSNLFQSALSNEEIDFELPLPIVQVRLGKIILRILSGKGAGGLKEQVSEIIESMDTDVIILACTDLQLVLRDTREAQIIDTMKVLAKATVKEILSSKLI